MMGHRARSHVLLTGDESYDTRRTEDLLRRASRALIGPFGYASERLESWLDSK